MPRQPRIDLSGYLYHIIIRGIERRSIYKDKRDYQDFLNRFEEVIIESDGTCFAWALMPNHAHLLIRSGKYGLADMMRKLLTGYAVCFNLRHKRMGHLFQNRYKSILCQSDTYLFPLIRYVHLNPVKAKIVRSVSDLHSFPWTSHRDIMIQSHTSWYDSESVLRLFGTTQQDAQKNYLGYLNDGVDEDVDFEGGGLIRSKTMGKGTILTNKVSPYQLRDERILGDNDFITELSSSVVLHDENSEKFNDKRISIQELIDVITRKNGITKDTLFKKNFNRPTKTARALIAYIGVNKLGLTNEKASRALKITSAAVSKMLSRNKREFSKYAEQKISEIIAQ